MYSQGYEDKPTQKVVGYPLRGNTPPEVYNSINTAKGVIASDIYFSTKKYISLILRMVFFILIMIFVIRLSLTNWDVQQGLTVIMTFLGVIWGIILMVLNGLGYILIVNPWTSLGIWGFILGHLFTVFFMPLVRSVFVVMYMKNSKHMKLAVFPKTLGDDMRPQIQGPASLLERIRHGGARQIKFHEDMIRPISNMVRITLEDHGGSFRKSTILDGLGVILKTTPNSGEDDEKEPEEILQYVTEDTPSGPQTFVTMDLNRIVPVDMWYSIIAGIDLEYMKHYVTSEKRGQLLERELEITKMDGALKTFAEYFPTAETIASRYAGKALQHNYRAFDEISEQIQKHAE